MHKGFTLIELILTISLIGVLSIIAASRFQTASGFDTYAIQGQVVSVLRNMQFRAMQDTRTDYCHRIIFSTTQPAIGPPSNDYSANAAAAAATCGVNIGTGIPGYLTIDNEVFDDIGASLVVEDGSSAIPWIEFDSLGRPQTNSANCASGCQITVSAAATSNVCINREGFIRAC